MKRKLEEEKKVEYAYYEIAQCESCQLRNLRCCEHCRKYHEFHCSKCNDLCPSEKDEIVAEYAVGKVLVEKKVYEIVSLTKIKEKYAEEIKLFQKERSKQVGNSSFF